MANEQPVFKARDLVKLIEGAELSPLAHLRQLDGITLKVVATHTTKQQEEVKVRRVSGGETTDWIRSIWFEPAE